MSPTYNPSPSVGSATPTTLEAVAVTPTVVSSQTSVAGSTAAVFASGAGKISTTGTWFSSICAMVIIGIVVPAVAF
jgi:hypothetical protein